MRGVGVERTFPLGEPLASTETDFEDRYQGGSRRSSAPALRSWLPQRNFRNAVLAKILANNFRKGSIST